MSVCEICNAEITESDAKDLSAVKLFSAVRMGYEPYSGSGGGYSCERRREDFLLLLEMHDPSWTLCHTCCDAVESHAGNEGDAGSRGAPEVIRIFGNGFQPEPRQWRIMLGAWSDKWHRKGIEVTLDGTPIEIEQCAKAPFEDFIEIVPNQKKKHSNQLVDELIAQDFEDGMVLVAVWSVKDSAAMKKIPQERSEVEHSNRAQLPHAPEGELWQPGHLIMGRFQISAVKRGSMGLIYFCKYIGDAVIPYVIKTLPMTLLLDYRELFLQEISTWVELGSHPHIVQACAGEVEERACLLLEYVAGDARHGSDLSGWIGTPELDLKRALTFAWQICSGMRHALGKFESAGKAFIHRDLKPTNLLVASHEQIKISDFGIAVLRDLVQIGLPPNTQNFGNRVYMSPEQCREDPDLDTRSDIYSFGCVLYEMLTGTTIFPLPRTSPDYMDAHLNESPRDPGEINPAIPPALNAVVMKCLRKDPKGRYPGFAVLQDELGRIYQQLYSTLLREAPSSLVNEKAVALNEVITKLLLGKATEALEKVEAFDVTQPDEIGHGAAIFKAETLANLGRNKEALEFMDRVLGQQPKDARLWNQRGRLLLNLERWEDALTSFGQAYELDRLEPAILNNKAYVLLELNRPKEALRCLETCLLLNPRLAAAWNNQGRAHAALEEWAEASDSYKKSVDSYSNEGEVWFNWSVAEANLQRTDSAKAHLRRCLIIDRLHWKALRNLAELLSETQQTEDDLAAVEDAIEAQKAFTRDHLQDLDFRRELVITLFELGRETEAQELAEKQESQRTDQLNKDKNP
jgi:serine/threonine protein kinase/Tfp pilus assembly protein PilF